MKTKYNIILFIIFLSIAILIALWDNNSNESNINEKIIEMGGKVESIDSVLFDLGPFYFKGNGQSVYKIIYRDKNGNKQEAWMRTEFINDEWVWDYKK